MSFQSSPPQAHFFYHGKWAEDTVNVFINILMDDVKVSKWDVKGDNFHSVEAALDFVNVMMNKTISWDETMLLMSTLRKRFEAFKLVVESPSVRWDREENFVYANTEVWQKLFEENNFTRAYYHKGDEMYDCLKSLFGTGMANASKVITISSDGPGKKPFNSTHFPFHIPDSDEEEEVESPVQHGRKPPRKQLFIEDGSGSCREMVSVESNSVIEKDVVKPVRDVKTLFGKFLRNPPNHLVGGGSTSNIKAVTSETDSSSPYKVLKATTPKK